MVQEKSHDVQEESILNIRSPTLWGPRTGIKVLWGIEAKESVGEHYTRASKAQAGSGSSHERS